MASEPLVQSPIAFAWGPDARLWVVEMGDYPLGVDGKGKPGGRIKILEDTKGDGVYDKSTIFLDSLPFPTGVLPWKKGILVTCAPDIFYVEETAPGKAGKPEVLYTGFVKGNQQHRVNSLVWGLDNWIHVANGDSGGVIESLKTGKKVNISGRDLRIHPDDGGLEAESGNTQYGRSRDDWGNWFGGNNSNPVWHFVLPDHYLRRNPQVAPPNGRVTVPTVGGTAPVYPISRTLPRFNDPWAANRFTSACSPIIYRDELFGPAYVGNSFVSEPVHNLVHREIVTPSGVTFTSKRAPDEQRSEFLASADNWFRPTMIQTGPDGSLWVADMYRAVIEHPQWIPLDWQKKLDLRAGHDRGRIYRVHPLGTKPRAIPRLDKLDTAGLVAALDHPNGWQRDLAHMMLLWKGDRGAIPHLEKLARTSKRPTARLHALCTLEGLGSLKPELLAEALRDEHPGLRRQAVRLCAGKLDKSAPLGTALLTLLEDRDDPVRMQLAFTLGEWKDERAGQALGRLAVRAAGDQFQTAAVLSSLNRDNLPAVLSAVLETSNPPSTLVEGLLRLASVWKHDGATLQVLKTLAGRGEKGYASWQFTGLASLLEGLERRDSSLAKLSKEGGPEVQKAIAGLSPLFLAARATVANEKAVIEPRRAALELLGREPGHEQEDRKLLAGLLSPRVPDELQRAAVSPLARWGGDKAPGLLLAGWKSHGPTLRGRILDVLLERDTSTKALLEALARKQISPAEVDAAHRQRLLEHRDKGIRTRAAEVLAGAVDRDRQKVIDSYLPSLKLTGNPARGKDVFTKACATCHKLGGTGGDVGPDLTPLASRAGEYLLEAIFDPNRAVEARYFNYVAELRDGRVLTGVLTNETSTSVTVVGADGKGVVVLRDNLESLTNSGKSAMPEGLEKDLKPQDVADLLAWMRSGRKPKSFPGNRPEVIRPDGEGTLNLLATKAEIYGSSLVLEEKYRNLGYWSKPDDEASWTMNVARAGRYTVQLDFACEEGAAGNRFVIEAGKSRLEGKVASTGNWDTYQNRQVGVIELAEGEQRLTMRPEGAIRGALIDLRGIRLVPVK
jgi:putative membrane-bound dehydrogenase-like protein